MRRSRVEMFTDVGKDIVVVVMVVMVMVMVVVGHTPDVEGGGGDETVSRAKALGAGWLGRAVDEVSRGGSVSVVELGTRDSTLETSKQSPQNSPGKR